MTIQRHYDHLLRGILKTARGNQHVLHHGIKIAERPEIRVYSYRGNVRFGAKNLEYAGNLNPQDVDIDVISEGLEKLSGNKRPTYDSLVNRFIEGMRELLVFDDGSRVEAIRAEIMRHIPQEFSKSQNL